MHLGHSRAIGRPHEDDHSRNAEIGEALMSAGPTRRGDDELIGVAPGSRVRLAGDGDEGSEMGAAGRIDTVTDAPCQFRHLRAETPDDDRW